MSDLFIAIFAMGRKHGHRWQPGESGNPLGWAKCSDNIDARRHLIAETSRAQLPDKKPQKGAGVDALPRSPKLPRELRESGCQDRHQGPGHARSIWVWSRAVPKSGAPLRKLPRSSVSPVLPSTTAWTPSPRSGRRSTGGAISAR